MRKNIKRETTFVCFVAVFLIILTWNSEAYPTYEDNCIQPGCHVTENSGVLITQNLTNFEYDRGQTIDLQIDIEGGISGMYALFHPDQKDNGLVTIGENAKVEDNTLNDLNSNDGEMSLIFSFTFPDEDRNLEMEFYIIFAESSVKYSKVLTFTFQIGAGSDSTPASESNNTNLHMTGYLGIPAVLCLVVGTLLYNKSKERFTKTHGILATTSLILTTINVIYIIPASNSYLEVLFSNPNAFEIIHVSHIIFGILGMIAGCVAIITGISGNRSKKPGYYALLFWGLNLVIGAINWGLSL